MPAPKSLTVLFTLLTAVPKFSKSKPAVLDNKPAAGTANVSNALQLTNLKSALKLITELMTVQVRYADILVRIIKIFYTNPVNKNVLQFFQLMLRWIGNLPLGWMQYVDGWKNETCSVSNVPGGTRVEVLDSCVLETVVPLVPLFGAVGQFYSNYVKILF